jgi:quercetin dioxygenase-like cupin family protein
MSSIDRPLAGDVMMFDLADEQANATSAEAASPRKSTARTLVKNGPLRITLVVLPPGGGIAEHHADGPISVQPLQGSVTFKTAAGSFTARTGDLLTLGAGIRHEVSSETGATFLLTVARA